MFGKGSVQTLFDKNFVFHYENRQPVKNTRRWALELQLDKPWHLQGQDNPTAW